MIRSFLVLLLGTTPSLAADWVTSVPTDRAFPLAVDGSVAPLVISPNDATVVTVAVNHLQEDLSLVTGAKPSVVNCTTNPVPKESVVLLGTLGHHPLIDQLVATNKLDVGDLSGAWESFVITVVDDPFPGMARALVVVGSDRRGTAFGVFELSQSIGVSPWHWWADVAPTPRDALYVTADTRRFGPPSVKYRGIFINDEDWGLQPWAATTSDPDYGDIGPRTYTKIFELLLRLKANTLWPAMHACTQAFNLDPANAALADDYAIVMGSSHAEPLLRNNVGEWTAPKPDYNYVSNREGVLEYWEERVETNGKFENLYTLGMRGIHDSGIQGTSSDSQRITVLEQVFADQRHLLSNYASPVADSETVPQIFCAYKEVLDLYRQGLRVPDDVTIVWPDDNFGYVRNFASAAERNRAGGFGVYYHISYLGRPLAYLWLQTTPPALIWEEMRKSYDHGADRVWIVNVGDLKPAEIGTEFFLQMAWDIDRWTPATLPSFLIEWASREFGPEHAAPISELLDRTYQLNSVRKPEHLQWWTPLKEDPRPSPYSTGEIHDRLTAFATLSHKVDALEKQIPPALQDAFFELVTYPIKGAALANERYFAGEWASASTALAANQKLNDLNAQFDTIANGKWRGFMRLEPADDDWRSMRIAEWKVPDFPPKTDTPSATEVIPAWAFTERHDEGIAHWEPVPGLGHSGRAVTVQPFDAGATARPSLSYTITISHTGPWTLHLHRLPSHPIDPAHGQPVSVQIDAAPAMTFDFTTADGTAEWSQGVLDNRHSHALELGPLSAGPHTLIIRAGPGLVLDEISLFPSLSGPPPPVSNQ